MTNTLRNSRGWLTKKSIDSGYKEERAWLTVGMDKVTVWLRVSSFPSATKPYVVTKEVINVEGEETEHANHYFKTLTEARECFKKVSTP